jgi:hypothetical protein
MRLVSLVLLVLLALGGAVGWIVRSEPDWYLRARYPLRYERVEAALDVHDRREERGVEIMRLRDCADASLLLATVFTPLINGPTIAVLTARTPEALRAKVMTAVISVSTLAGPLGFLVAGQVLEHWGVVPLFTAVAAGITLRSCSRRSSSGTARRTWHSSLPSETRFGRRCRASHRRPVGRARGQGWSVAV